jgi:hypothetical protein
MKNITLIIFLVINLIGFAQTSSHNGTYQVKYDTDNAIFEYTLNLESNGTFTFHSYTNHFNANPKEKNQYGKGKWVAKKNLISFIADENIDINDKFNLNLNNTRARIDMKSPRNKTSEIIPTTMRIYNSDIFWIKGLKLTKI